MKRTSLPPGPGPRRHTPMRTRNRKRAAAAFARNFGRWSDAIRAMPCWLCGGTRDIQAAHMVPRSRGGDRRYLLPLGGDGGCGCHRYVDSAPAYRATLVQEALALYEAHHPEETR
jgi:hypothetical protein